MRGGASGPAPPGAALAAQHPRPPRTTPPHPRPRVRRCRCSWRTGKVTRGSEGRRGRLFRGRLRRSWAHSAETLTRSLITPNGKTAYVVNQATSTATPIRTATNKALKPIHVPGFGGYAGVIGMAPNGKTVYVAIASHHVVSGAVSSRSTFPARPLTLGAMKTYRVQRHS